MIHKTGYIRSLASRQFSVKNVSREVVKVCDVAEIVGSSETGWQIKAREKVVGERESTY
jgi:hypothetical protein